MKQGNMSRWLRRREFLKVAAGGTSTVLMGSLLAACQAAPAAAPQTPQPAVSTPTPQVVEKIVQVVVTPTAAPASQARGPVQTQPFEVTIANPPVWDSQLWWVADQLGYLRDVGIKVKEHKSTGDEAAAVRAVSAGSLDLMMTTIWPTIPQSATIKNLAVAFIADIWWGGALMVRRGQFKTYKEILAQVGDPHDALAQTMSQLKGKTFITNVDQSPQMVKLLDIGGLTVGDVKSLDMQALEGATAFIRGEGDVFSGTLPTRMRVAEEGGVELTDQKDWAGLREAYVYVFWVARKDWLEKNEDQMMRLMGAWLRVSDSLKPRSQEANEAQDKVLGFMRERVNKDSGANFTLEQGRWVNKEISPWFTFEEMGPTLYDPIGEFYWRNEVQRRINEFIKLNAIKSGDVAYETYSQAEQLYKKLAGYKTQTETTRAQVQQLLSNNGAKDSSKAKALQEWSDSHYFLRNYVDSASLAADALKAAQGA